MRIETDMSIGEKLLTQFVNLAYLLGKYCYGIEIDDSNGGGSVEYIDDEITVFASSLSSEDPA